MLLGQLQVPAEFNYYVSSLNLISYTISAYGPTANFQTSVFAGKPFAKFLVRDEIRRLPQYVIYRSRPEVLANVAGAVRAVQHQNQNAAQRNERLFKTLRSIVKTNLPDDPQPWWEWWLDENERYLDEDNRTYYRDVLPHRPQIDGLIRITTSCFVAGTPVWTETGPKPIEQVKVANVSCRRTRSPENWDTDLLPIRQYGRPARR